MSPIWSLNSYPTSDEGQQFNLSASISLSDHLDNDINDLLGFVRIKNIRHENELLSSWHVLLAQQMPSSMTLIRMIYFLFRK